MTLNRSAIVHNGTGVLSNGSVSFIVLMNSIFIGNGTGLSAINSGSILSPGNNLVLGNLSVEGAPTGPVTLK